MKLVEDTSTKRVFEEYGKECESCIPTGTMVDPEGVLVITLIAIVGFVALELAIPGFQLIQQGTTTIRVIAVTLVSILVCSACWIGIVVYLLKERRKARNRIIRYEFNLVESTLSIDDTMFGLKLEMISPHYFGSFTIEIKSPCYRVQLLYLAGPWRWVIWSRREPPPTQFVSTLIAIGLRKEEDKNKKS